MNTFNTLHIMRCPRCNAGFQGQKNFVKHVIRCKVPRKVRTEPVERPVLLVPCLDCGEKFENARECGQHRTRKHFGEISVQGSSLRDVR